MKRKPRFTYAGTVRGIGPRAHARRTPADKLPADWKRMHMHESGASASDGRGLNLPIRVGITVLLVVICLAVISKEPILHDQIASALGSAWEQVGGWFAQRTAAEPTGMESPGESLNSSRPVLVENAPAEFQPVALVTDGGIFALGKNGEVKTCGPDCTPEKFPVVTGLKVREVPGTMGVMLKTTVDMEVLYTLLDASWVDQVSEINMSELPRIAVFTRDAVKIKLNADAQLEQNVRRLASVLKDVHGRGEDIVTVDARYKDQIVVRPRTHPK